MISKHKTYLLIFVIVGVILRLGVVFVTKSNLNPELFEYEDVIRHLFAGEGFILDNSKFHLHYYAAIHPLFTFICAGIYLLTNHSFLAVEIFQILISVATGIILYKIGSEIFNKNAGLIAAFFTIFHPGLIIYSTTKIASQTLDTFFFTLIVFWILKTRRTLKISDFLLLGIFIGLAALARGTLIIALPIVFFYYWLSLPFKKIQVFKKMALVLLTAVAILSPWWIRNYLIFKKPVYMTTESTGYVLWVGFNANATGTLYALNGKEQWEEAPGELKEKIFSQTNEIAQQDIFRREAINFIIKNPIKAITLYIKRIIYFWWFTPTQGLFYPAIYFTIYRLFYVLCLSFALAGFIYSLRSTIIDKLNILLVLFIIFGLCLLQSFYYVEGRHRWEIEPLLLMFSAYGIQVLCNRVKMLANL